MKKNKHEVLFSNLYEGKRFYFGLSDMNNNDN